MIKNLLNKKIEKKTHHHSLINTFSLRSFDMQNRQKKIPTLLLKINNPHITINENKIAIPKNFLFVLFFFHFAITTTTTTNN